MEAGDLLAAGVALLVGMLGAYAGYRGAMRSAARSSQSAWATNAVAMAQALLESDDPALREAGMKLLLSAVQAMGASPDTPRLIREATRTPEVETALERGRSVESPEGEAEYVYDEGDDDDD